MHFVVNRVGIRFALIEVEVKKVVNILVLFGLNLLLLIDWGLFLLDITAKIEVKIFVFIFLLVEVKVPDVVTTNLVVSKIKRFLDLLRHLLLSLLFDGLHSL